LDPLDLQRLTLPFAGAGPDIATLVCPIQRLEELEDPNIVKAVGGELGQALYFSRSPIPYLRDLPRERWMEQPLFRRHIGIYAFSSLILREICALPPSGAERAESLEQLRWLAAGYTIRLIGTSAPGPGVDTPADLEKAERLAARYSA
ncbi:MAG TPA: 3-deoxy-manno-octulosonate cytidylyltransferase, partial [Bacteroidales bacterium]|nr:3-deoxy-manno-octulosonate cytidylyltransferase [Bacteroidales bacterium]